MGMEYGHSCEMVDLVIDSGEKVNLGMDSCTMIGRLLRLYNSVHNTSQLNDGF